MGSKQLYVVIASYLSRDGTPKTMTSIPLSHEKAQLVASDYRSRQIKVRVEAYLKIASKV